MFVSRVTIESKFMVISKCCDHHNKVMQYILGYFHGNSRDINYNPDRDLTAPEIIKRHGYKSESHVVQTEDGYLLTLHRIPSSKTGIRGSQPVYLQHGLLSSSLNWIDSGSKSLGFILADKGYDVWLGNTRGNIYSRGHAWKSIHKSSFWDFSWHEMGVYDLPAIFSYISETTEKEGELLYIGQSMGTTIFFVYASTIPESSKVVKAMVGMAPVAFLSHIKSPGRGITRIANPIYSLTRILGIHTFMSRSILYYFDWYITRKFCESVFWFLHQYDEKEFDMSLLPVVLRHLPAGTSIKTIVHFMQLVADKYERFKQFDYGKEDNMVKYNQTIPPSYRLDYIRVPMYLMYAKNDLLAAVEDVMKLQEELQNNVKMFEVPIPTFCHVDFLWGKRAPEVIYKPAIDYLNKYRNNIMTKQN